MTSVRVVISSQAPIATAKLWPLFFVVVVATVAVVVLTKVRGTLKKCVNSQAVYPLSEQHGLKAQERR